MFIEPTYYSVFYDVDLPKDDRYAMRKSIKYYLYLFLTYQSGDKEVELDGAKYKVVDVRTFRLMDGKWDNKLFVVCDVKKIK